MKKELKLTEEQKKEIVDLYNQGETITNLMNKFLYPMSNSNFYFVLRLNNVLIDRKNRCNHNLTGRQYGYLTVLKMVRNEKSTENHPWRAICKCTACGKENVDVEPQSLKRSKTTSCGCKQYDSIRKARGKNSKSFKGYEKISGAYWGKIQKRAATNGLAFTVDIKDAWEMYLKQNQKCILSGIPIEFNVSDSRRNTASLDRIDSNKGYLKDNVQWVHKDINIMKNSHEQNYFISLCEAVTKNKN